MSFIETLKDTWTEEPEPSSSRGVPAPGLLLVFSAGRPLLSVIPLQSGSVEIGRESTTRALADDPRMSRKHAAVTFDGRRWSVRDLGSRNGTAVDGAALRGEIQSETASVVRMGASLFLLSADTRLFQSASVTKEDGIIMAPTLLRAWTASVRAARFGRTLHITGESGSGKELAARTFHACGPRSAGPFIAVNCAAIPEGVAERLFFGARRGAFSGAFADAEGYVQAAHGGTLFLDEVAELDQAVQAKLLRVLETHEVLSLGAARASKVNIGLCSATHKDLRAEVAAGRLREDFYFRIARPHAVVPPLRERLEEIPWLLDHAVKEIDPGLSAHVSLVEECLLRPWPGNVREIIAEARVAAQEAIASASQSVEAKHLSHDAGSAFTRALRDRGIEGSVDSGGSSAAAAKTPRGPAARPAPSSPSSSEPPERRVIEEALRREKGNISRTARALGIHRMQLRRWIAREGVDVQTFAADALTEGGPGSDR